MIFKYTILIYSIFFSCFSLNGQNLVAITIDDIPNTFEFENDGFESLLLDRIDSLNIPVAIFINEGLLFKNNELSKNTELLNKWCADTLTTLGNHTFNHKRYSTSDFEDYKIEIIKGETITRVLADKYGKSLTYFRFPYNDLGKDSLQQVLVNDFLKSMNYTSTPFTIESSDWMYNAVYEDYLKNDKLQKAKEIGIDYVNKTIEYFDYFEKLSKEQYGRNINHVYLCHDNPLNRDFLPLLIDKLKDKQYNFISLDQALQDDVYKSQNNYYKKWGVSWFYRWMTDKKEIKSKMMAEPSVMKIYDLYKALEE